MENQWLAKGEIDYCHGAGVRWKRGRAGRAWHSTVLVEIHVFLVRSKMCKPYIMSPCVYRSNDEFVLGQAKIDR